MNQTATAKKTKAAKMNNTVETNDAKPAVEIYFPLLRIVSGRRNGRSRRRNKVPITIAQTHDRARVAC